MLQELKRQSDAYYRRERFYHYRDKSGAEVDVVVQRSDRKIAGVEAKASATVKSEDFRGLLKLRDMLGTRFANGVVLYNGEAVRRFSDRLYAVPIQALWEPGFE